MKRIRLSKEEKEVFRMVSKFGGECPSTYPAHVFNACISSLERKGLVKAHFVRGGRLYGEQNLQRKANTIYAQILI
jgi:hypothetical protein